MGQGNTTLTLNKQDREVFPNGAVRETPPRKSGLLGMALSAGMAILAFYLTWLVGHRGVFLWDQSIIIDGAWRIVDGQVPYKDFVMPFGPVTFWIQALFFQLLGANWSATVASAATLNLIATIAMLGAFGALLPKAPSWIRYTAGFATAVLFQTPFGTLWLEQSAFFFNLLGVAAIIIGGARLHGGRFICYAAAGVFTMAAFFAKQNAGAFFVPVLLALIAAYEIGSKRRVALGIGAYGAGLVLGAAAFTAWLFAQSDPQTFKHWFFDIPRSIGLSRVHRIELMETVFLQRVLLAGQLCNLFAVAVGAFTLLRWASDGLERVRPLLPAVVLCIGLPYFQNLFQLVTENDQENVYIFSALAVLAAVGLASELFRQHLVTWKRAGAGERSWSLYSLAVPVALFALTLLVAEGARSAWMRVVQQFGAGVAFDEPIDAPGFARVKWGNPTYADYPETFLIERKDLEELASYLSRRPGSFFLSADATLLYAFLGRTSPQPVLYFYPGHSYTKADVPLLDEWISRSLESNDVQTVVVEQVTYVEEEASLNAFPKADSWVRKNFHHARTIGLYDVWERNPS